ncbi:MAG: hypothetical protein ACFFEJ_16535 [Candidatus Thorarchaeota archaeon]
MKRWIGMLMVASLLLVGVASAASGLMTATSSGEWPFEPADGMIVDNTGSKPWIMGAFFLSLAVSEISFGTLMLYYFGKRRAFDVGIVPLELEEDELERLFEEFMSTP